MTIHLCTQDDVAPQECICCGGWLYSGGYFDENGKHVHVRDPLQPYVSHRGLKYCSSECLEDWEGFLEDEDVNRQRQRDEEDAANADYVARLAAGE